MATNTKVLNTVPQVTRILATNEKVTGPAGVEMILRSGLLESPSDDLEVGDIACGGGILTAELLRLERERYHGHKFKRIVALDKDPAMVQATAKRKGDNAWVRVEVVQADQEDTKLASEGFSYLFNNFGVFFSADDSAALREVYRLLKVGGVAAFTSWEQMTWWNSVAVPALEAHIPEAPALVHPGGLFPGQGWNRPEVIAERVEQAGFVDVNVSTYQFNPVVEAEEFAEACAFLVNIVCKRTWSSDAHAKYGSRIQPAILTFLNEKFVQGRWDGFMHAIITVAKK